MFEIHDGSSKCSSDSGLCSDSDGFLASCFSRLTRPPMALTDASMEYLFDEVVRANSFYTN